MYHIYPFLVRYPVHKSLDPPSHWFTHLSNNANNLVPRDHILCLLNHYWRNKHRIGWTNVFGVLMVHRVVCLGLVVPVVLAAVEGMGDPFEPVLQKDLRKVLEQVLCLFQL